MAGIDGGILFSPDPLRAWTQQIFRKLRVGEEDALLLADFTMLKTVPGEDYKVSLKPANQVAQCIDGVLVLFDTQQKGLTGVLVDSKKQAVRCMGEETPQAPQQ